MIGSAKRSLLLVAGLVVACGLAGCGGGGGGQNAANRVVKVGAVYPLSGSSATAGEKALEGVRLAADIVNQSFPDLALPLAGGKGLPNLDGAKVRLVSADHRGDPSTGALETERLITDEGVVAVIGAYLSSVTATSSRRADELHVPFVNGASSSPDLTERGLAYFFRTGPSDRTFGETFFDLLDALRKQGKDVSRIGILHENTDYGSSAAQVTRGLAAQRGYQVACTIAYRNGVGDVTPQVRRVASCNPDVLFQASYTPEAILFTRTFRKDGYTPNIVAYGAGFSDQAFFEAVGKLGDTVISRAAWVLGDLHAGTPAKQVADMFEKRFGHAMDENSARTFTAALTLFYAINEAASTEPDAIRNALAEVHLSSDQTIMPWGGVRFDEHGQNQEARGVVVQYLGGEYKTIFPFDQATAKLVWPEPAFDKRG